MNRLPRWGAVALVFAAFLVGCGATQDDPYPPFRYRMTVEVETPEGLRTGSAVREVDYVPALYAGGNFNVFQLRLRGEAVAVDLPGGRTLYALLSSPRSPEYAAQVPIDTLLSVPPGTNMRPGSIQSGLHPSNPEFEAAFARMVGSRDVREVTREPGHRWTGGPPEPWPLLITFRDPRSPTSVEQVDPENSSAQLGAGYRIRRITIAITDDPVTTEIGGRLLSQGLTQNNSLDAEFEPTTAPTLAQQLGWRNFTTERN